MSLDFDAIAEALAARYANLTPPTNYRAIIDSTSNPPNNIPATPYVIVWTRRGEVTYTPGRRDGEHDFDVMFLAARSEGDIARRMTTLKKWLGILLDATNGQMALGLAPTVAKAIPVEWEFDVYEYGGQDYDGFIITVRVWTRDNVTLVA
jgi:hypothetical protein